MHRRNFFLLMFVLLIYGCATPRPTFTPTLSFFKSSPETQTIQKELFDVSLTPYDFSPNIYYPGYCAFQLTVTNKSDKEIEIDWNRTLFIQDGKTNGSFMFEGVWYGDRNNIKSPDIIFPKSTISKVIWPNNLVQFTEDSWVHHSMGVGNLGVSLSLKSNGKEIRENLILKITSYKKEPQIQPKDSSQK